MRNYEGSDKQQAAMTTDLLSKGEETEEQRQAQEQ